MEQHELERLLAATPSDRVAIVVAHQDDEAIGFCSTLLRSKDALVVHVTDGAPEDPREWKGCRNRGAYAELRRHEVNAALDAIGHIGPRVCLGVIDTKAAWSIAEIAMKLVGLFVRHRTSLVFTHAFEGGHPDHDATAFAVHIAARDMHKGRERIIEAPFYRAADRGPVWQEFVSHAGTSTTTVALNDREREAKIEMLAAHESQGTACGNISTMYEQFREAPEYDFSLPPNDGRLCRNYERAELTPERWSGLVEAATTFLSL